MGFLKAIVNRVQEQHNAEMEKLQNENQLLRDQPVDPAMFKQL